MSSNRTRIIIGVAWLLLWSMLVATAVQDYARDDGRAYWQPVL